MSRRGMTEAEFRRIVGNDRADALLRPQAPTPANPALEIPAHWDLPMPPSTNQLWDTVTDHHTGKKKRVLTEKARDYKRTAMAIIRGTVDTTALYTLRFEFHYPWYYKNGKLAKFDETNRLKLIEDCLATALGIDDNHFKRPVVDSIDTTNTGRTQAVRLHLLPLREN